MSNKGLSRSLILIAVAAPLAIANAEPNQDSPQSNTNASSNAALTFTLPSNVDLAKPPQQLSTHFGASGVDMVWKRLYDYIDYYHNKPDIGYSWLKPADGLLIPYTSPGPGMKPDAALTPLQALQAFNRTQSLPRGQPGTYNSYFALLHKHDNMITILPFNFDPAHLGQLNTSIVPWHLTSLFDAGTGKYLFYVRWASFNQADWDKTLPSWSHFEVWWFDPKTESLTHVVLPRGPWVGDAMLDDVFLRSFRNFSCGVDCYRQFELSVDSGNIFVAISGQPAAIHQSMVGTYELRPGSKKWEKVR